MKPSTFITLLLVGGGCGFVGALTHHEILGLLASCTFGGVMGILEGRRK